MIFPVRCFTCNKLIADKWLKYIELVEKSKKKDDTEEEIEKKMMKILEKELELKRYCCKRHLIGHVDILDKL